MLSSDQNVETLSQLFEKLKTYLRLQGDYVRLDISERVVRLVKALALFLCVLLLLFPILFFFSMAIIHWLSVWTGAAGAYCIVAGLYVVILLCVVAKRKNWIERPLVRFLTSLLLND